MLLLLLVIRCGTQSYEYRVKSGGVDALWSEPKSFRALYSGGADGKATRVAIYGGDPC